MTGRFMGLKVIYGKTDITEDIAKNIENVSYTDCATSESDSISLTIDAQDTKWMADWMPETGTTLHVSMNTENWDEEGHHLQLDCGDMILDDVSYSDLPSTLTLGAVAKPNDSNFSERKRSTIWRNTSIKRIGATIAARYKLRFAYDGSDYNIEVAEQDDTDSAFLQELCKNYGMILKVYNLRMWIYDREMYKARVSATPLYRGQLKPGTFQYTNSLANTYTGGDFSYTDQDKDCDITARIGGGTRTMSVNRRASSVADAAVQLVADLNDANHSLTTVRLGSIGHLNLTSGEVFALVGFGVMDGNYFIDKVTHSYSRSSGYEVQIEASKIYKPFAAADVGGTIVKDQDVTAAEDAESLSDVAQLSINLEPNDPAGKAVTLNSCPLYAADYEKAYRSTVSGTYYLYDGWKSAGRYMICSAPSRCGAMPSEKYVTGWIDEEFVK